MPEKMLERNRKSRRLTKVGARRDEWTKLDTSLRLFIYRHVIAKCRAPSIAEMTKRFKSRKQVDAALQRLCASHPLCCRRMVNCGVPLPSRLCRLHSR